MMKEEKQETSFDPRVLAQKAQLHALTGSRQIMTDRLDSKRKVKAKKVDSSVENTSFIGQPIHGVVDGSFDAGYLLTCKVGETDTILRGVVFEPGGSVPITEANDIAPNVKWIKRDGNFISPEALQTSKAISHKQHSLVPMLQVPISNDVATSFHITEKFGADKVHVMSCQISAPSSGCIPVVESIPRLPYSMLVPNDPATSLHFQNQIEHPTSNGSGQTNVVSSHQNAGPSTATIISPTNSKLPPSMLSVYEVPKSVIVPNQIEHPVMVGSGQSDIVPSQLETILNKLSPTSESEPMRMPVPNALASSSAHRQSEMKLPVTISFGQTDKPAQPDASTSKSTTFSVAASMFPLSKDASDVSFIHELSQKGPLVSIGLCQTKTVIPEPDAMPSKSTFMSEALSVLYSVPDTNPQATSEALVEKMGPPIITSTSQKDIILPQQDTILLKTASDSQAVSSVSSPTVRSESLPKLSDNAENLVEPPKITGFGKTDVFCDLSDPSRSKSTSDLKQAASLLFPVLVQDTQLTSSVHVNQVETSAKIGSGLTGVALPLLNAISSKSSSVSHTVPILPVVMPLPNAPLSSSVIVQNQTDFLPTVGSNETCLEDFKPDSIPHISASTAQDLLKLPISMPNQSPQGPLTIIEQNQSVHLMKTGFGQTDMLAPCLDLTSSIALSVPPSHSEQEPAPGPSDQVCDSMKATEMQMDVDGGA